MALNHALTRAGLRVAGEPRRRTWCTRTTGWSRTPPITLKHHLRRAAGRHPARHRGRPAPGLAARAAEPLDPLGRVVADVRGAPGDHLLGVHALGGDPAVRAAAGQGRRGAQRGRPGPLAGRARERVAAARRRCAGDGPLVAFSGRLVYEKGVQDLLAAVPRLRRRHPGLRLVVAGRRAEGGELREQARRLRLGRAVRFAGFVPDAELAALVAAADCAVVPEPVRAVRAGGAGGGGGRDAGGGADAGGLRGVRRARASPGCAFPAGDPAALADAVGELLADEVLARRLVTPGAGGAAPRPRLGRRSPSGPSRRLPAGRPRGACAAGRAGRPARRPRLVVRDGNLLTGAPDGRLRGVRVPADHALGPWTSLRVPRRTSAGAARAPGRPSPPARSGPRKSGSAARTRSSSAPSSSATCRYVVMPGRTGSARSSGRRRAARAQVVGAGGARRRDRGDLRRRRLAQGGRRLDRRQDRGRRLPGQRRLGGQAGVGGEHVRVRGTAPGAGAAGSADSCGRRWVRSGVGDEGHRCRAAGHRGSVSARGPPAQQ